MPGSIEKLLQWIDFKLDSLKLLKANRNATLKAANGKGNFSAWNTRIDRIDKELKERINEADVPEAIKAKFKSYIAATTLMEADAIKEELFREINPEPDTVTQPAVPVSSVPKEKEARSAEACYQQYLLHKANEAINATPGNDLRFDPQARVLIKVTLTLQDYQNICQTIATARGETVSADNEKNPKEALEELLGEAIFSTTDCSIDIRDNDSAFESFKNWLCTVDTVENKAASSFSFSTASNLTQKRAESIESRDGIDGSKINQTKVEAAVACLLTAENKPQLSSITALQETAEMYISRTLDVYRQALATNQFSPVTDDQWNEVRDKAILLMTASVRTIFQAALLASHQNNQINFVALNDALHRARAHLKNTCQDVFVKACMTTIPNFQQKSQEPSVAEHIHHKAYAATPAMPATSNDYFTYSSSGLHTRISGSDTTSAMSKGHQAMGFRSHSDGSVMMRLPSIPDVGIKYMTRMATWAQEVRTSFFNTVRSAANSMGLWRSFANKNEKGEIAPYENIVGPWQKGLDDTADTIAKAVDALQKKMGAGYQGPFILNREASIPNILRDNHLPGANRSALRIEIEIKAVHQVNVKNALESKPLVFMQGMPVNQHAQNLGYQTSGVLKETTLMTEMAMLANLHAQGLVSKMQYKTVMATYQSFVSNQPFTKDTFFSDSQWGQQAITALQAVKNELKTPVALDKDSSDLKVLANQALSRLFAHDLHLDQRYGMLIQALSTYGQTTAITDCKSATGHFSEVERRADLLRQLNLEPCTLPQARAEIQEALQSVAQTPTPVQMNALMTCLDKRMPQGRSSAAVSLVDQPAASTVDRLNTGQAAANSKTADHAAEIQAKIRDYKGPTLGTADDAHKPLNAQQIWLLNDMVRRGELFSLIFETSYPNGNPYFKPDFLKKLAEVGIDGLDAQDMKYLLARCTVLENALEGERIEHKNIIKHYVAGNLFEMILEQTNFHVANRIYSRAAVTSGSIKDLFTKVQEHLPPATGIEKAESSTGADMTIAQRAIQSANSIKTSKYGALAIVIATFVLSSKIAM